MTAPRGLYEDSDDDDDGDNNKPSKISSCMMVPFIVDI